MLKDAFVQRLDGNIATVILSSNSSAKLTMLKSRIKSNPENKEFDSPVIIDHSIIYEAYTKSLTTYYDNKKEILHLKDSVNNISI